MSRRHALIVRQPDGLRVLDDRSLNGVFVNGERVEWSTLADSDEVVIGRHHLHFVDVPATRYESDQDEEPEVESPDFPEGIDYNRWTKVVRPSPREAFADPLDRGELLNDE